MGTRSRYIDGRLTFFDPGDSYKWTRRETVGHFHEDFTDLTSIPGDGSKANGTPWVQDITGAAPPTAALGADASGGTIVCSLTADDQAQDATVHFDDTRYFDLSRNLVFQAKFQLTTLPTLLGFAHIGLTSDHATPFTGTTYNAGIRVAASGVTTINQDDNATVTATTTTFTAVVSTNYVLRIEFFDLTQVRYYINGVYYGSAPYAATGANAILQPYIGVSKASGAGLGVLSVDTVDIWWD